MGSEKNASVIYFIHFNPLERYPPVMNMLDIIDAKYPEYRLKIFTTRHAMDQDLFQVQAGTLQLCRPAIVNPASSRIQKAFAYLGFHVALLINILKDKPGTIVYFETFSAVIPFLYKKIFNRGARMFVHYHEYISTDEFKRGSPLLQWAYRLEKQLLPSAEWVSHTNQKRMDLFLADMPHTISRPRVLPNYPPRAWLHKGIAAKSPTGTPIRFVYIGSLDDRHFYFKEFAQYISRFPGQLEWDIYSNNIEPECLHYIAHLGASNIFFKGSIPYNTLPEVLPEYHIGLVLYKGHIKNFIYNIPNKVYEYAVCGLEVWYHPSLEGITEWVSSSTISGIVPINFSDLQDSTIIIKPVGNLQCGAFTFTAEQAVQPFLDQVFQK